MQPVHVQFAKYYLKTNSLIEFLIERRSAHNLAVKLGVDCPIISGIYRVIHEGADARAVVHEVGRSPQLHHPFSAPTQRSTPDRCFTLPVGCIAALVTSLSSVCHQSVTSLASLISRPGRLAQQLQFSGPVRSCQSCEPSTSDRFSSVLGFPAVQDGFDRCRS